MLLYRSRRGEPQKQEDSDGDDGAIEGEETQRPAEGPADYPFIKHLAQVKDFVEAANEPGKPAGLAGMLIASAPLKETRRSP